MNRHLNQPSHLQDADSDLFSRRRHQRECVVAGSDDCVAGSIGQSRNHHMRAAERSAQMRGMDQRFGKRHAVMSMDSYGIAHRVRGAESAFASIRKLKITAEEVGLLNERGRGIPFPSRSVSGTRWAQVALGRAAGRRGLTASRRIGNR